MKSRRQRVSNALYVVVVCLSVVNFLAIVVIHFDLLLEGKGIGSFTPLWVVIYVVLTFPMWLLARVLSGTLVWDVAYWALLALHVALVSLVPVGFFVE